VDLEVRLAEHAKLFAEGAAAKGLQDCFAKFGEPSAVVLMDCHPDHLDFLERFYINLLKPSLNLKITGPVTDAAEAIRYPELLTRSTVEHISEIVGLRNSNMVLVDKLDLAHDTIKRYEGLDDAIATVSVTQSKTLDLYEDALGSLEAEKKKTWLDKLLDRFK